MLILLVKFPGVSLAQFARWSRAQRH